MKRTVLAILAAAVLFAGVNGIPPRKNPTDYPAHQTTADVTLAAALLSPSEAKNVFIADLDRAGYLVFEVAVYPENNSQVDLSPIQFSLRTANSRTILATVSPDSIIGTMYKGKQPPQIQDKVSLSTSTTIGYETGPRRTGGGVYGGSSANVGVGNPSSPPPTPTNKPTVERDQLLAELTARELPEVKTTTPVAGYLYFAKPEPKPKDGIYQLTFNSSDRSGKHITLDVPAPGKNSK